LNDVIDIAPHLKHRRSKDCEHAHCTVDDEIADLACDDCGAQLDPWWFIRRAAKQPEFAQAELDRLEAIFDKRQREWESWVRIANAELARLSVEVQRLRDLKHDLRNERLVTADGVFTLGDVVARARRRRRSKQA
jgi:hypothetical protein